MGWEITRSLDMSLDQKAISSDVYQMILRTTTTKTKTKNISLLQSQIEFKLNLSSAINMILVSYSSVNGEWGTAEHCSIHFYMNVDYLDRITRLLRVNVNFNLFS